MATMNLNPAENLLPEELSSPVVSEEQQPEEVTAPSFYTITKADIDSSKHLQKLGVVPGDEINKDTKKLKRNYSSVEDKVEDIRYITERDIALRPDLAEKHDVDVGDAIVDGKLVKTGNNSTLKQLAYGFEDYDKSYEILDRFMDARGIGVTQAPEEYYGEGFTEADVATKRQMINRKYERLMMEKYGRFFKYDPFSVGGVAGTVGGVLTDPASYVGGLALKSSLKAAAAIEAGVGAGYSIGQDVTSDSGRIDPTKAALYAGGGALLTAAPVVISRGLKTRKDKKANKLIDDAQQTINDQIKGGGSAQSAIDLADKLHNLKKIQKAERLTGRNIKVGKTADESQKYLDELIQKDPIGAQSKFPKLRKIFANMRTEIGMRSPKIQRLMDTYDRNTALFTENYLTKGKPFLDAYNKLSAAQRRQITKLMYNGDFKGAKAIMPQNMRGKAFDDFVGAYDELGDELLNAGHVFTKEKNYVHRGIKDYSKLRTLMSKPQLSELDKALAGYAKKNETNINAIPQDVKDRIANQIVRGRRYDPATSSLAQTKERTIKAIDDKLMDAYDDLADSFNRYVRTSVNDIEKRKFFGRHKEQLEGGALNVEKSVGNLIREETERGVLKDGADAELIDMIQSRFGKGEAATGGLLREVKNVGYMGTIANMTSAVLQLADMSVSVIQNGLWNTTRGLLDSTIVGSMANTRNMKLAELGIKEVANDLTSVKGTQKLLDWTFKYSGFQRLDRLGKETFVNAAFRKNVGMMKSAKGEAAFRKEWGRYYGDEINDIVNEFKALAQRPDFKPSDVPDSIKAHMLSELMGIQPVGRTNVPQAYLDHPDGRPLYMLKMWTLKQYDLMRRNVIHEWKRGNKVKAAKYAAGYAVAVGLANGSINTLRNAMQGRDVRPEDIPLESVFGLFSVFGFSKYGLERYLVSRTDDELKLRGDVLGFAGSQVAPPMTMGEDAIKLVKDAYNGDFENPFAYMRSMPIVGPIIYGWFGGGANLWNERNRE